MTAGILAGHSLVSAIPFFVPTFIVVLIIGVMIWRDRRNPEPSEDSDNEPGNPSRPA